MKVSNPAVGKKRGVPAGNHQDRDSIEHSDSLDRRALLAALQAVADGDFSARLPSHWTGLDGKISDRFNEIVAANQQMAPTLSGTPPTLESELVKTRSQLTMPVELQTSGALA